MINTKVENCNNITLANIQLRENYLNIRYAMNGTGKSTIAKAMYIFANGKDFSELVPFDGEVLPSCSISPEPSNIFVFNEDYVDRVVLQDDEAIQDAFEVFIKTPEYERQMASINNKLMKLRLDINENPDIQKLGNIGKYVLNKLTTTSSGQLRRNPFYKSIVEQEKIFKLPDELKQFEPFVKSTYIVDWVGWKIEGATYDDNNICPFCTTELNKNYDNEKKLFSTSYSESNVKNIKEMLSLFEELKDYMNKDILSKLITYIKEMSNSPETISLLITFWNDLNLLVTKIDNIKGCNTFDIRIKDIALLDKNLKGLKIDINDFHIFNNEKIREIINSIDEKLDFLLEETDKIKEEIGRLNGLITSAMKIANKDVNNFLKTAGINYEFEIIEESENKSRAILKYIPNSKKVSDIRQHLSWGERNAFALVLFMYHALNKKPNIIILDDPISSFDSHKKYAIINRLFSPDQDSFFEKTVLMLTHDMQPLIDMLVINKPINKNVVAYFLLNKNGIITEQEIQDDDIKPLPIILTENAKDGNLNIIHRLACLRKLIETLPKDSDSINNAYHLISSLIHIRIKPTLRHGRIKLTPDNIESGSKFIHNYVPDFNYDELIKNIFNKKSLLECFNKEKNPYIRIQIFRLIIKAFNLKEKKSDYPLIKYIDEQLHIENDYMFSLNFLKYDFIPDFVVPKCCDFISKECIIN